MTFTTTLKLHDEDDPQRIKNVRATGLIADNTILMIETGTESKSEEFHHIPLSNVAWWKNR
jgi:hypothetical protein